MASFWLDQLGRTVWKGHNLFLSLLWEAGYRFAKTLSNTLTFTCPRGKAGLALRGNRLYVPSQPLRPVGKLEFLGVASFCQIWIPNYSLLAKPLYEATKWGEWEPLVWGREQEGAFVSRRHSQRPLL
jgi:hypothetical protein